MTATRKRGGGEKIDKKYEILGGPMDCTKRELALMAFHESGLSDNELFSQFWCRYQELLVQKLDYETQYLTDVLNKQGEERAREAREQRSQELKFALLFSISFLFGSIVTLFFRL